MKNVEKKYWALILGASSGFGGAAAIKLAEDGYNIIGVHLDRAATMSNVESVIDKIKSFGVECKYFNINAADETKRIEVINEIKILLNDESLMRVIIHSLAFGTLKRFIPEPNETGMTKTQLEMTIDVMANSLVYWVQGIFNANLLSDSARIFGMTSSGGYSVIPNYGAVSAAKAVLESHLRQLSAELGFMNVSANAILAGVTDTPALRKIPGNKEMKEISIIKNPRNRLTTPQDVAKVISLLCKDGGEWISGGTINADGGETVVNYVGKNQQ